MKRDRNSSGAPPSFFATCPYRFRAALLSGSDPFVQRRSPAWALRARRFPRRLARNHRRRLNFASRRAVSSCWSRRAALNVEISSSCACKSSITFSSEGTDAGLPAREAARGVAGAAFGASDGIAGTAGPFARGCAPDGLGESLSAPCVGTPREARRRATPAARIALAANHCGL